MLKHIKTFLYDIKMYGYVLVLIGQFIWFMARVITMRPSVYKEVIEACKE